MSNWLDYQQKDDEEIWKEFVSNYRRLFKFKNILFYPELFNKTIDIENSYRVCKTTNKDDKYKMLECEITYRIQLLSLLKQQIEIYKALLSSAPRLLSNEDIKKFVFSGGDENLTVDRKILKVPKKEYKKLLKLYSKYVDEITKMSNKLRNLGEAK